MGVLWVMHCTKSSVLSVVECYDSNEGGVLTVSNKL